VAGSPYVINAMVTVAPGVTLTIEPGVIVKFAVRNYWLYVRGSLVAKGTAGERIYFTSLADDAIGGDTGGDGPTVGAPGQWYHVWFAGEHTISSLHYVDFRYGGYGSADHGYAPVNLSAGSLSVDHARFTHNQRSAIVIAGSIGRYPAATVKNSLIEDNGQGISVNQGAVAVDHATIRGNASRGVWFNLLGSYAGSPSHIINSEVSENGTHGVWIWADTNLPREQWPTGTNNNIYSNNGGFYPASISEQLYSRWIFDPPDWTGNYWGDNTYSIWCPYALSAFQFHVAYFLHPSNPQKGPLASTLWVSPSPGSTDKCLSDNVRSVPHSTGLITGVGYSE
jgi:hypothetical protein